MYIHIKLFILQCARMIAIAVFFVRERTVLQFIKAQNLIRFPLIKSTNQTPGLSLLKKKKRERVEQQPISLKHLHSSMLSCFPNDLVGVNR